MIFLTLLCIPLLLALVLKFLCKGITWKEFCIQIIAQLVIAGISCGILYYKDTTDQEIWNGWVTDKKQVQVSCSHSYQCFCYESCSGTGKNRSCHQVCQTCYEHSHDYDWNVYTSNSETIEIDRVDSQGVNIPPRWQSVNLLEPVSTIHNYTNYIKAAPDSLFRHQGLTEKFKGKIPKYPNKIYDYYRVNRLVLQGVDNIDINSWNNAISKLNSELGAIKQTNIIVVLTNQPHDWFYALEESWIGGKKNDVILVIGVDQEHKPVWSQVMAWTIDKTLEVKLRDSIMELKTIEHNNTLETIRENVQKYYKRKPMKDFEYLKASITPTSTELTVSVIIGMLLAIGLSILLHKFDIFDEERSVNRRNIRYNDYY